MDLVATNPVDLEATNPVDLEATNPMGQEATNPMDLVATNPVDLEATNPVDLEVTNPVDQATNPISLGMETNPISLEMETNPTSQEMETNLTSLEMETNLTSLEMETNQFLVMLPLTGPASSKERCVWRAPRGPPARLTTPPPACPSCQPVTQSVLTAVTVSWDNASVTEISPASLPPGESLAVLETLLAR